MASDNDIETIKAVAKDVSETLRNGQKVNMGKIMLRHGYSDTTSKHPKRIKKTKTYINTMKTIVEQMQEERNEAMKEAQKKRGKANYSNLIDSVDKLTKNIQLLSGGDTSRDAIKLDISETVAKRYDINPGAEHNSK
jgi:seryl-tRNA synthetase